MCGIVGAAGRRLQLTSAMIERMRDTLAHRGPDDAGAWLATDGILVFGSELKALLAYPGFPRRLDLQALNRYLAFAYVPREHCMLQGVRKLPAAHLAVYDIDADTLSVRAYWNLPEPARAVTAS